MKRCVALVVMMMLCAVGRAQQGQDVAVKAVLTKQVDDWNRGDLAAFEKGYKESPDILFVGRSVRRGYAQMAAAYSKGYGSREAMGTLSFKELEVHALDARFATVLGKFHLERTAAGGGNADGIFSLVLERTSAGWKIVLDHTSESPAQHP